MRNFKSIFGILAALLPVIYCGGLLYYFLDLSGSVDEAVTNGLGPTVVGLGAVGLLFCMPLLVKIVWFFAGPRAPGSRGRTDASTDDGAFDPDAVIARHMARRSADATSGAPAASPPPEDGAPRATFGRKIR